MKKSPYDLSYQYLLSANMGEFIPCGCKEILPNDSVRHQVTALIGTMALSKPLMHRVNATLVHYFVPTRIIWDDFKDFITGGPNGTSAPVHPYITIPVGGFDYSTAADYLGVTPKEGDGLKVSALRFRAMAAVFNTWIRDQDLVSKVALSTASGFEDQAVGYTRLHALFFQPFS